MTTGKSGIAFFTLGILCYTTIYALQKPLTPCYPATVILFYRFAAAVIITLPWLRFSFLPMPRSILPLILLATTNLIVMLTTIVSLEYLPLGHATILFMTTPIFLLVLAPFLLPEHSSIHSWLLVAVGMLGTLLVTGVHSISLPDLWALASALAYAFTLMLSRHLTIASAPFPLALQLNVLTLFLITPFALAHWIAPQRSDLLVVLAMGGLTWLGELFTLLALQRVQSTLLAPFEYTSIVFAILIGYVVWSDVPSLSTITGASIITITGVLAMRMASK